LFIFLIFLLNAKSWPFVWHSQYKRLGWDSSVVAHHYRSSVNPWFTAYVLIFTVKVWYPAIMAHIRARRLGLKGYYRHLQIGIPLSPTSIPTSPTTTARGHKFEHPLGVKSVKKFTAGFDDCKCSLPVPRALPTLLDPTRSLPKLVTNLNSFL
jgi:hypothetical protein